ncbi:MAG: dolichyl-phosphate beta-glucosyltransferase [Candidatus Syntropharchaeia archaeon]
MRVSVVVPVYNEVERLERCIERLKPELERISPDYEIIIAEDGSTDGTKELAEKLSKENKNVIHLHSDERLGRGRALNRAFKMSSGDILVYMDADLATDLRHLETLIGCIRDGAHFATGSRMLKGSDTERPMKREIASRIYNFLVRFLFRIHIRDMQCGFKAFERKALFDILDEIEDNHWFWDTECLIRADRKGYRVVEFPVRWRHEGGTKVEMSKDAREMGKKLIKLWWRLWRENT